jgi:hypothetical protein
MSDDQTVTSDADSARASLAARRAKRLAEQLQDAIAQQRETEPQARTIRQFMVIDEVEALLARLQKFEEWTAATVMMAELRALDETGVEGVWQSGRDILDA